MRRTTDKKSDIVRAAAALFRRQGYAGTGLSEILSEAQAPKGSLYHYFPEGKEAIGVAAVEASGAILERQLRDFCEDDPPSDVLMLRMADYFGAWLERSGFREGCGIATVVLETTPYVESIRAAGERAYASWRLIIEERLAAEGVEPERAKRLSGFAMSVIQGGLLFARVARCTRPLTEAAEEAADALRRARPANPPS